MRRKQARLQSREARENVGQSMFGDTSNKDEDFMKTGAALLRDPVARIASLGVYSTNTPTHKGYPSYLSLESHW